MFHSLANLQGFDLTRINPYKCKGCEIGKGYYELSLALREKVKNLSRFY